MSETIEDSQIKNSIIMNLPKPGNPVTDPLRTACLAMVETFFRDIVQPMRERGGYPVSKTNWFFSLYREGIEATRLATQRNIFSDYVTIDKLAIESLVQRVNDTPLDELYGYGASFTANAMNVINGWYRDQAVLERYNLIYSTGDPLTWIDVISENESILKYTFPEPVMSAMERLSLIMKCNQQSQQRR